MSAEVVALAEQRQERREAGDYQAADQLRDAIGEAGYEVLDTADGFTLRSR